MGYHGIILAVRPWNDKTRRGKSQEKNKRRMGTATMRTTGKAKCPNQEENMKNCNCSYTPCSRKGICCECIAYHKRAGELPACYFPDKVERTFDRSIARFKAVVC